MCWIRSLNRSAVALCLFGTVLCVGGCSQHNESLVPVGGRVTIAGKPLRNGSVSFRPDAAKGNLSLHHPTGRIEADGGYQLYVGDRAGVPPGHYKVVIFANEPAMHDRSEVHPGMPDSLIDRRYNAPQTTPLYVEVTLEQEQAMFDFELEPAA